MFGRDRNNPQRLEAAERLQRWTRERFSLAPEAAILVAEVACGLPGCPPLETVVSFWDAAGTRYQFKLFKRLDEATTEDLPFAWMKDGLAASQGIDCDCC